jgi:translocation and assembly module TamA
VFHPGNRYRFGVVTVVQDSASGRLISESVVRDHLDFREGDFFSEARKAESERNLNRLGVFETSRIEPLPPLIQNGTYEIPTNVIVRTRPFHELSPEIGANDEDRAFNALVGLGYNNRNFLGGARNLNLRSRVSVQNIQEIDLPDVLFKNGIRDSSLIAKFELASEIVQPYFFSNKTRIVTSLAYIVEKQRLYLADILRGRLGVSAQLARFTRGSIDWNLERIKPEALSPAAESVLIIRDDLKPQFNSILTATIQRDRRNDLFSPSEGFFHSLAVEEAGLLPNLFGSLGGNLPYSRYYKIWSSGQWYWDPSGTRDVIWALRLTGGFAELYGDSPSPVPLTRRFYGGGGGSVRGWRSRSLGAVLDAAQGGNAMLEANAEARWNLFKNAGKLFFIDLANISLVGFVDMGNVWTEVRRIRGSEIAVAAGTGLRWNTIAGPIRIDFALRIHDPFEPPGRTWITQRRFFHETYGLVQLGIGHAF